jgi:hypothetical protein
MHDGWWVGLPDIVDIVKAKQKTTDDWTSVYIGNIWYTRTTFSPDQYVIFVNLTAGKQPRKKTHQALE